MQTDFPRGKFLSYWLETIFGKKSARILLGLFLTKYEFSALKTKVVRCFQGLTN
jgi:hypothetical protein